VEVALEDGTYSFGSGPDSDVQFVDVTLAPIHGHLRIRGGKLALRSDGARSPPRRACRSRRASPTGPRSRSST
jgi:hypothetical protein